MPCASLWKATHSICSFDTFSHLQLFGSNNSRPCPIKVKRSEHFSIHSICRSSSVQSFRMFSYFSLQALSKVQTKQVALHFLPVPGGPLSRPERRLPLYSLMLPFATSKSGILGTTTYGTVQQQHSRKADSARSMSGSLFKFDQTLYLGHQSLERIPCSSTLSQQIMCAVYASEMIWCPITKCCLLCQGSARLQCPLNCSISRVPPPTLWN